MLTYVLLKSLQEYAAYCLWSDKVISWVEVSRNDFWQLGGLVA